MAEPDAVKSGNLSDFTAVSDEEAPPPNTSNISSHQHSEAEKALMEIIDLNHTKGAQRAKINTAKNKTSILLMIRLVPDVLKKKYDFSSVSEAVFPLAMLCYLGASNEVLEAAYKAHPPAVFDVLSCVEGSDIVLSSMKRLIQSVPDCFTVKDDDGWTGLHEAVGCLLPLDLIELGSKELPGLTRVQTKTGQLPIHVACEAEEDCLETITYLAKKDPDTLKATDENGCSPLHLAIKSGASKATIDYLISTCPEALKIKSAKEGWTPFLELCGDDASTIENLQLFVESHPEVLQDKDLESCSPLHLAVCMCRPLEIVQFLVDKMGKEALMEKTVFGQTPLHLACRKKTIPAAVVKYLSEVEPAALKVRKSSGNDPLLLASKFHSSELVGWIINEYPDVVEQKYFEDEWPILHVGAYNGWRVEIMKLLAEKMGVDALKVQDKKGRTPLSLAVKGKKDGKSVSISLINYLLKACPDARMIVDNQGNKPLDLETWEELAPFLLDDESEERAAKRRRTS